MQYRRFWCWNVYAGRGKSVSAAAGPSTGSTAPCLAPIRELKELTSDSIDMSSSDEGDADDVLQGLLAQLGMGSDGEPPFEKECATVARMAGLPRIMDDLDNEWLEAVHIGPTLSPPVVTEIRELLVEYKDCFALSYADLEKTPGVTFHIKLKEGAIPVHCGNQWRFAPLELDFMKSQLEALETAGLIMKWENDVEWLSFVTFPPKKGGDLRFCCTYVALNKATVPDSYPLPRVDEVLEDLAGYPLYTTVDGFSGYYTMGLDPESVPLTAFLTPFGIYVWLVLPFGLRNAPPHYSRLVARAYGGLERTRTFVDDGGIGHTGEGRHCP